MFLCEKKLFLQNLLLKRISELLLGIRVENIGAMSKSLKDLIL